jgi:hypothetical protein
MTRARRVKNRQEISQLDQAIQNFLAAHEVDYMPSRITLNGTDAASNAYLDRCFKRWRLNASGNVKYKWNGQDTNSVTLQGHQCLVFFLGGIPTTADPPACQGFSGGTRPDTLTTTDGRSGPYFEFQSDRLRRGSNKFLVYLDTHNLAPYAYFSPGKVHGQYVTTDCSNIASSFSGQVPCNAPLPYRVNAQDYWRADSWQIISAGADGKFGTSKPIWGASSLYRKGDPGFDDQANFTANLLSARP